MTDQGRTMTDLAESLPAAVSHHRSPAAEARLRRRYAAERRFRAFGIAAVSIAVLMLVWLLTTILGEGTSAFSQTRITLEVQLDPAKIDPGGTGDPSQFDRGAYQGLVYDALYAAFPDVSGRVDRKNLRELISPVAGTFLAAAVDRNPKLIGQSVRLPLPASDNVNQLDKGKVNRSAPEEARPLNDKQIAWFDTLKQAGQTARVFNTTFFTASDSNYPELAGIYGATVGSIYTLLVTLALALPMGVATAVYLEEFAPKNRLTELIEVNINNLAAVPSIVFGLLGLAVFLQFVGLPRSAPLVGGLVLALMILPTIIIAARASLKSVPPSIREAALGMGASRLQAVMHHVLPLAMPGIMTGTIIAMAHALGETAPLLMVGMNAFVTHAPSGLLDSSAVLPVQIFIWADRPERGFTELTSAAIMMLLVFLVLMNGAAIALRSRFERRW
jgi:phosphate transport system permease protein